MRASSSTTDNHRFQVREQQVKRKTKWFRRKNGMKVIWPQTEQRLKWQDTLSPEFRKKTVSFVNSVPAAVSLCLTNTIRSWRGENGMIWIQTYYIHIHTWILKKYFIFKTWKIVQLMNSRHLGQGKFILEHARQRPLHFSVSGNHRWICELTLLVQGTHFQSQDMKKYYR